MNYAKVVTKRDKQIKSIELSETQNKEIVENHERRKIENLNKQNKVKITENVNVNNIISLEEKNNRIANELDRMSRTLGIRIGNTGLIEKTTNKLIELNKISKNINPNQQKQQTLKALAQNFILNELKLPKDQYLNTNINKIWDEERQNCEIINVTFKEKQDIARINSNLKNLNKQNSNKIYQYVPNSILKRFKGFEEAAYKLRIDNQNGVNTKIRAGKDDLVLLVRQKK